MSVLYKAEDTKLGRPVALKFLPEKLSKDHHAVERIKNLWRRFCEVSWNP